MILRVLTARVPSKNIGQFNDLLRAQLAELQTQPGLVYAKLARRLGYTVQYRRAERPAALTPS